MKRYLILALVIVSATKSMFAQDPHFSQIQYNPLYLNPAFAGVTEYGKANRLAGLYRDQWRTLPVPYSTTTASYDRLLKKFNKGWLLGGGVSFLYDKAGDGNLSIFNPNLTMNFGKYFNKEKQLITLGITAGITIKSLDSRGLQFDNQYNGSTFDPNLPNNEDFSNNMYKYGLQEDKDTLIILKEGVNVGKSELYNLSLPVASYIEGLASDFDVAPEYLGGEEGLMNYLGNNIMYPQLARESNIQGTVYVTFVIRPDGTVSHVKILRGIGGGCDEEAIRVVSSMSKWKPATNKGKPVYSRFNLPIRFILH